MQLTNGKREQIRTALIQRGMAGAEEALAEAKTAFGVRAYNDLYSPKTQVRRMLDDAAGKGWFNESSEVRVSDQEVPSRSEVVVCLLDKTRAFLAENIDRWESPLIVVKKKDFAALLANIEAVKENREKLEEKVTQILWGCRTWKQLYEAWPAGVEIFDKFKPVTADKPMVVRATKSLNDALGLPP